MQEILQYLQGGHYADIFIFFLHTFLQLIQCNNSADSNGQCQMEGV